MARTVDFLASRPHYAEHLEPIWQALPETLRGRFAKKATELGEDGPVVVASYLDLRRTGRRPAVLAEHGSGQSYGNGQPSYAGGRNREQVGLFICPSGLVADLNRARYPDATYSVVGCPKMDRWAATPRPESGIIAIAFHWDGRGVAPEAGTAWFHYRDVLPSLKETLGDRLIGTGHPRIMGTLRPTYRAAGIPIVDANEVFEEASVLVVDNSSIGWEFLSLERPVVWMNAPWYRRNVEFGLRFWSLADSGVQTDHPSELSHAIEVALTDPPSIAERRREIIPQVYAHRGDAAKRAAGAIVDWLEG